MNKTWLNVVIASLFEVGWVIGLKHASTALEWAGTLVAIVVSFYTMIMASRKLPVGTVYAVFVGLGTVGTVISDIVWFDAPVQFAKIALIGLLLLGVIGLKIVSNEPSKQVNKS
ncbi:MAG: SMR family transporter [Candidatus Cohnella colombiensis]|uniref:SMR family transporter n=1 Tax=Candidatus Cohnella colombiensis TaxID=3121368 RepID=A0AA95EZR6_9BACL|nr:MAG: SMR family transporter [Cohnella sp.]